MRGTAERRAVLAGAALALLLGGARRGAAQNGPPPATLMASERATLSQTVDGTTITVDYARPRLRGRTGIFGTEVKWEEVWTPGANDATTLRTSKDVTIAGMKVPAGKYSVWMVVRKGDWELVLDPDTTLFHMAHPKPRPEQLRVAVTPRKHARTEALAWHVPEVTATGMTLEMTWDTVVVPLAVTVPPTYETDIPAATATPLLGRYHIHWAPPPPRPDSVPGPPPEPQFEDGDFIVRYERGQVHVKIDPPLFGEAAYGNWMLLPKGSGIYGFAQTYDGRIAEIVPFIAVTFTEKGGVATGFEMRAPNDDLIATGTRLP